MELNAKDQTPDPRRVARRGLVMSAVLCRCYIAEDPTNPEVGDFDQRLKSWLDTLALDDELEPEEEQILNVPLGAVDARKAMRATWQVGGLSILGWSLGTLPFPELHTDMDTFKVTDALCFLSDEASAFVARAKLRPRAELEACREYHYGVHCRLRQFIRERRSASVDSWFAPVWSTLLGIRYPLAKTGDLAIGSRGLSELSSDELHRLSWLVTERHRASIWLVGEEGPRYWDFPVDT